MPSALRLRMLFPRHFKDHENVTPERRPMGAPAAEASSEES
jgi:hypothetical protein